MKRLCAGLLILIVFVVPAICVQDDEIRVSDLVFNSDPNDDGMAGTFHGARTDQSPWLSAFLDQLCTIQISNDSLPLIKTSNRVLYAKTPDAPKDTCVAVGVGRAPPAL